jgi:hypothetical protein
MMMKEEVKPSPATKATRGTQARSSHAPRPEPSAVAHLKAKSSLVPRLEPSAAAPPKAKKASAKKQLTQAIETRPQPGSRSSGGEEFEGHPSGGKGVEIDTPLDRKGGLSVADLAMEAGREAAEASTKTEGVRVSSGIGREPSRFFLLSK